MTDGTRQIFFLLIPATVFLGLLAEPVTRLVFEHGDFNAAATALTRGALRSSSRSGWSSTGQPALHPLVLRPREDMDPDDRVVRHPRAQYPARCRALQADGHRRHRARHLRRELRRVHDPRIPSQPRARRPGHPMAARRLRRAALVAAVWLGAAGVGVVAAARATRSGGVTAGPGRQRRRRLVAATSPTWLPPRAFDMPELATLARAVRPAATSAPRGPVAASATSASSPTSTTASRRSPTVCSS